MRDSRLQQAHGSCASCAAQPRPVSRSELGASRSELGSRAAQPRGQVRLDWDTRKVRVYVVRLWMRRGTDIFLRDVSFDHRTDVSDFDREDIGHENTGELRPPEWRMLRRSLQMPRCSTRRPVQTRRLVVDRSCRRHPAVSDVPDSLARSWQTLCPRVSRFLLLHQICNTRNARAGAVHFQGLLVLCKM